MKDEQEKFEKQLEKMVLKTAKKLERAAKKGKLAEFFDDATDVKITIDGHFRYCSALIQLAIGGPAMYFDTASSEISACWGFYHFKQIIDYGVCDAVDDYFEDYFETVDKNEEVLK